MRTSQREFSSPTWVRRGVRYILAMKLKVVNATKRKKKGVAFVSPSLNCTPIFTVNSERKGYWHRIYMLCFLFFWKYKGGGSKWCSKVIRIVRWYRETLGDCYLSLIWKDTNFYQTASSLSFARKSVSESIWAAKPCKVAYRFSSKGETACSLQMRQSMIWRIVQINDLQDLRNCFIILLFIQNISNWKTCLS